MKRLYLISILFTICLTLNIPHYYNFFTNSPAELSGYVLADKQVSKKGFKFTLHYMHQNLFGKNFTDASEYLQLEIYLISNNTLQFIFTDPHGDHKEMPKEDPFPYHVYPDNMVEDFNMNNLNYDYEFNVKESPFSLTILRKATKEVLFSTVNKDIIFKPDYVEITTDIPSEHIFGFGERTTTFRLKSGIYTIYNKDLYGEVEDGKGENKNRYGAHPMYLMREKSGNYHVNYLRNTYPMDVTIDHSANTLNYKIIGGVLDFTLFLGDKNPETAIKRYHKFLGGYSLPPFWAMGFHQCRWGYKDLGMVKNVLKKYKENDLPLDTIWMDIDYMQEWMNWTVDTYRYNPKEFQDMLNEYKKKFVPIAEPSIGTKWGDRYEFLFLGKKLDLFIKNAEGNYLINKVWPGKCHFIDYFNPSAKDYWAKALDTLYNILKFNGLWIDMSEIAAFNDGQMDMSDRTLPCGKKYPYKPGKRDPEHRTVCPNAIHYGDRQHIEVHNYYPNMQAKLSFEYLEQKYPDEYPFILTRANAAGIGKYSAHWSGDNYGTDEFYKYSIAETMNFNLFGAPIAGADICGFGYNTPELLCAKWYQMGSLYPFSRSHNHLDYYNKEPFAMGSLLLETTKRSLQFRYSILKYYYSLFMRQRGVGTIFKPIFLEFYDDIDALNDYVIDNYFMIGDALLNIPNLHTDETEITNAYFPHGQWYDMRDNSKVKTKTLNAGYQDVKTNLREMPAVYLRQGKTIFTNDYEGVMNTYDLHDDFNLIIALDEQLSSRGVIPALSEYHSRSKVDKCMKDDCFVEIVTTVTENKLTVNFSLAKFYGDDLQAIGVKKLVVLGVNVSNPSVKETSLKGTEVTLKAENEGNTLVVMFDHPVEINDEEFKLVIDFNSR
jgi:alpha-glucosidase (family GH31 glycosyl hydrolase)